VATVPEEIAAPNTCSKCGAPAPCSRVWKGKILYRRCDGSVDEEKEQRRVMALLAQQVDRFVGEGHKRRARDLRFSFEDVEAPSLPSVPLPEYKTPLVLERFEEELARHPDLLRVLLLLDSIRNKVNIGYDGPRNETLRLPHHKSATEHPDAVEEHYAKEMAKGRVTQWWDTSPFKTFTAQPLGVVPKTVDGKETGKRIINDFTAGGDDSVNAFINKIEVEYGDYESLVDLIVSAGKGALLSKFDVKSAFRLLAVRLHDLSLQVVEWRNKFAVDLALVFGSRSSPPIWHRVAYALSWILRYNYNITNAFHVDDFLLVHGSDKEAAIEAYKTALRVCEELGVPISLEKSQGPSTSLIHVGLVWDTEAQKVTISDARRKAIMSQLDSALKRRALTAKEILSLHGRLTFVARVLQPARSMLWYLRNDLVAKALSAKRKSRPGAFFRITAKVKNELAAWQRVLRGWGGEWLLDSLDWEKQGCRVIHSDACETGSGGYSDQGLWFAESWDVATLKRAQRKERLSLPFLEMQAAVTSIKSLAKPIPGQALRVLLWSDCLPVVQAVNLGYCHEEGLAGLLFDLAGWCVENNVYLRARHLSSGENRLADLLSRARVCEFVQEADFSLRSRVSFHGQ